MKKYLAITESYYFDYHIKKMTVNEIEITRETPKKFEYKRELIPKTYHGNFQQFHQLCDSFDEAKRALIDKLEERASILEKEIINKKQRIEILRGEIEEIQKLSEN